MENSQALISIDNLSKTYRDGTKALDSLSLEIPYGMFGLLGPNGAGKSSLMRTLATLQEPDIGSITMSGLNLLKDKQKVRRQLGYLPQDFGLIKNVSAKELLLHFGVLKGIINSKERNDIVDNLLVQTNLWDKRKNKVSDFSGGMKQRFGLAVALLANPKLLIVDEPTSGLDPLERVRILNLLAEVSENCVVLISTHIVEDVADICTNMAIIKKGQILLKGKPTSFIDQIDGYIWEKVIDKNQFSQYTEKFLIVSSKFFNGRIIIHVYSSHIPDGFKRAEPDLKDVYFCAMNDFHSFSN